MESEKKLRRVAIMGGMICKSPDGDKVKIRVNRDAYNEYEYYRIMGRTTFEDRAFRHNEQVIAELSGR